MTHPTIIIAGQPTWADSLAEALAEAYAIVQHVDQKGYMNAIINAHAALIVVDGEDPQWRIWTSLPKASPATRRTPILLVADRSAIRAEAAGVGADVVVARSRFLKAPAPLIERHAKRVDPALLAQLDCDCQETLPELAREGVRQFNAGAYYQQHDLFEEQWVNTDGPVRDLYQAILQVGVGYFQIQRGNYRGALKMLQRSVKLLWGLPDVCQGVDVRQLREDSSRVRAELERLGEDQFDQFDMALIKGVVLVDPTP